MPNVTFYRNDQLPFLEIKHCSTTDFSYHKHFHEEYSLGLIDSGVTNAWCDGTMHRVEAGRLISFPPHMLHACHPDPEVEWTYRMLFIAPEWLRDLEPDALNQLQIPFLAGTTKIRQGQLLINRMMAAMSGEGSPLEIEASLIELIHTIVRPSSADLEHEWRQGKQEQKYAKLVQEYLHAHFSERITLDMLEEEVGISKFHLVRLYKKWSLLPPHAYQNLLKINHAKTGLMKKKPIAEIAADLGFHDQSHFTKTFNRIVGATPQQYALSL